MVNWFVRLAGWMHGWVYLERKGRWNGVSVSGWVCAGGGKRLNRGVESENRTNLVGVEGGCVGGCGEGAGYFHWSCSSTLIPMWRFEIFPFFAVVCSGLRFLGRRVVG